MAKFMQKLKDMWTPPDDEYDYDESDEREDIIKSEENNSFLRKEKSSRETTFSNGKIVNLHTSSNFNVVLFKPERFGEETRAVADEFLKTHTIVLNLENTNSDDSRRILDFLSGVAYANGGKIKKVATGTIVITPYNVSFSGNDVLDEIENNGEYF